MYLGPLREDELHQHHFPRTKLAGPAAEPPSCRTATSKVGAITKINSSNTKKKGLKKRADILKNKHNLEDNRCHENKRSLDSA